MSKIDARIDKLAQALRLDPGEVPVLAAYPDAGQVQYLNMLTGDITPVLPPGGRVVASCAFDLEAL